ncbi:hypothetical protein CCR75_007776 [Bremia lactucae]|uniref:Uncharacterized protein n=1 Tax=Bremia lactucae TaxID=4779 RepID=A0A976NYN7_BRELC|nr:hypothetical protein CCR75_007776 [Bremia lactucae]
MSMVAYHQIIIDVSASLTRPNRMSTMCEFEASHLDLLRVWTVSACKKLLASTSCMLEWTQPSNLNATALAGILLCYPCVYTMAAGTKATHISSEQLNCLAMCPLYLLQTSILLPPQNVEIPLHEFSVPQYLHHEDRERGFDKHSSSHLKLLKAQCRLQLQRTIDRSCLASTTRAQVRVTSCTLLHVAL